MLLRESPAAALTTGRGHIVGSTGRRIRLPALLGLVLALNPGCASPPLEIDLMPAPAVYAGGEWDPFADASATEGLPDFELPYVTLRRPAVEGDSERFYANETGGMLRAGVARVRGGDGEASPAEVRRLSLESDRSEPYALEVSSIRDLGVVDAPVFAPAPLQDGEEAAREHFRAEIRTRLSQSAVKDLFVYVHGYKVVFEDPVLVASELWHFMGYRGAMVAFSWASTPSAWAYFSDLETAATASRGLRRLLQILAAIPEVERIHVVGYSAGTRVVTEMLDDFALLHQEEDSANRRAAKLGRVVLVGSDVGRETMGAALEDGLLNVVESLTVYQSTADRALGMSRRSMGGRNRMGEVMDPAQQAPETAAFLEENEGRLTLVDVTDAERYREANGHRYFLTSPWVASDVLLTVGAGLTPAERGLERPEGSLAWTFPADYPERLPEVRRRLTGSGNFSAGAPVTTGGM